MRTAITVLGLVVLFYLAQTGAEDPGLSELASLFPRICTLMAVLLVIGRFSRGDSPRRAWIMLAASIGALLLARGLEWVGHANPGSLAYVCSNLFYAAATLDFLRVLRSSPLVSPIEGRTKVFLRIAIAGAIIAATAGAIMLGLRLADHGWTNSEADFTRVAALIALGCDATVFVASLAVAARVLPMAGGIAARPYLLLAAAGLVFLILDLLAFANSPDFGYFGLSEATYAVVLFAWALYTTAALEQYTVLVRTARD